MKRTYSEVREVLRRLVALGYIIDEVKVDDEDDCNLNAENGEITAQAAYDKVNEYDNGYVFVKKDDKTSWLYFVLGSEPGVALSNYSVNHESHENDIDKVGEEVYDLYNSEEAYEQLVDAQDALIELRKLSILATL